MKTAKMNYTAVQTISRYFTSRSSSVILKRNYKGGRSPAWSPKPLEKGQIGGQKQL